MNTKRTNARKRSKEKSNENTQTTCIIDNDVRCGLSVNVAFSLHNTHA